jgi:hypothetical protein
LKKMSTIWAIPQVAAAGRDNSESALAASITREASKQTYYTIRILADHDRMQDAYRAYGYFRWVDDRLDQDGLAASERAAFVRRQQALMERCYQGDWPRHVTAEERLLVDLIRSDTEPASGLQTYIRQMMAVMAFDAERRGRLVSGAELERYTRWLAVAVTEAMAHFVGHERTLPSDEGRYLAVTAAHITHMLRDAVDDAGSGYFNLPREYVEAHGIDPHDVTSAAYRTWVRSRVQIARDYFERSREYFSQVDNPRYCLAAYAYIARFECVLDSIERDDYLLRAAYPERKSVCAALRMGWSVLAQGLNLYYAHDLRRLFPAR